MRYEIQVDNGLDHAWSTRVDGMQVSREPRVTVITCHCWAALPGGVMSCQALDDARCRVHIYPVYDGELRFYGFANGYCASVTRHMHSYGGRDGLFELAVLDRDGHITFDTPVTNDVVVFATEEEVQQLLGMIATLPVDGSLRICPAKPASPTTRWGGPQ